MSISIFVSICIAVILAIAWSLIFLRKVLSQKKLTWKDFKAWIKNVIDSLFGMG